MRAYVIATALEDEPRAGDVIDALAGANLRQALTDGDAIGVHQALAAMEAMDRIRYEARWQALTS